MIIIIVATYKKPMLMANRGTSQTIVFDNGVERTNDLQWSADYDGKTANLDVVSDVNGETKTYSMKLNNDDLANLLTVPSVPMPLHKRLSRDFGMMAPRLIRLPATRTRVHKRKAPRQRKTRKYKRKKTLWSTLL